MAVQVLVQAAHKVMGGEASEGCHYVRGRGLDALPGEAREVGTRHPRVRQPGRRRLFWCCGVHQSFLQGTPVGCLLRRMRSNLLKCSALRAQCKLLRASDVIPVRAVGWLLETVRDLRPINGVTSALQGLRVDGRHGRGEAQAAFGHGPQGGGRRAQRTCAVQRNRSPNLAHFVLARHAPHVQQDGLAIQIVTSLLIKAHKGVQLLVVHNAGLQLALQRQESHARGAKANPPNPPAPAVTAQLRGHGGPQRGKNACCSLPKHQHSLLSPVQAHQTPRAAHNVEEKASCDWFAQPVSRREISKANPLVGKVTRRPGVGYYYLVG